MSKVFNQLKKYVPKEWLIPTLSPMFPKSAKEIGLVCKAV